MSQHMIHQIPFPGLFSHAHPNSYENIMPQIGYNIFQPVMTAGTALFSNAQLTHIQANIIGNDDQLRCLVRLIIIHQLPDAFPAEIHKGQRLRQNTFLSLDHPFADYRLMLHFQHGYIFLLRKPVYDLEADIMSGVSIFLSKIAQSYNDIHIVSLSTVTVQWVSEPLLST